MYQPHDYLIHGLMILSALGQLVPAFYAARICRLTGYVRFWSEGWIIFILGMLWILFRRAIVAWSFDPRCDLTPWFIFSEIGSTLVTSAIFTVFTILKHKFFSFWLETDALRMGIKRNGRSS